jgi:hypothetical protein
MQLHGTQRMGCASGDLLTLADLVFVSYYDSLLLLLRILEG